MKYIYISNEYPWQIVDLKHVSLLSVVSFINTAHLKKESASLGIFDSIKVYFIKCFGPQILWYKTLLKQEDLELY